MKTLTEKYQALKEGNFSKKQFLRDARLAHPNLITQFNGFNDAIRILKAKGLVHEVSEEYETFDSEEELNAFLDKQVEKDKAEKRDTEDDLSENVEKDILDTISLNQVKKGIRYELEQMGVKSVKVSAEDWNKAKDKVRKNIEKDQNYYVHKLADVKPVKHDKRPDTMKEVPSIKNKDSQSKKNQKKVKDQHNQMEKVKINEFKKIIKKVILESLGEQEDSMGTGTGFKEGHRALVNMLDKVVNTAEKVGQAGEQERDALAADPDATTYAREIEEYLRKIYNAYLYADREAGRDDEIFKEEVTKESISDEAYDRMEGISNIQAQQAVKKGSGIILRELTEEGFDETEILEFLQVLIKTNYGIVTEQGTKEKEYEVDGLKFYTAYNPPKGYCAKGVGEAKGQISLRYFDTEEQAKEHGELELRGYLSND